ncbi:hypothetical protein HYZ98_00155 [Candidatus Peregrinibacteria bacterium]|nr:hypothetical protein [Candidatus Peregrinibacteria bacterium]
MDPQRLQQKIQTILERNTRVEQDKAWEVSIIRRTFVAAVTYSIACYYLWLIGVPQFWLHAAVPAGGYILSTLSLPWIRKWWMKI